MTTPSSPVKTRNLVAALLAGGLITSLSACGVTGTNASSPVSESQPIAAAPGSPLVQCGMAQLTPRVAAGDPVLSRGSDFFNQLQQSQQVPPAVQKVYTVDIPGLNDTQKHEVLLFLSSLNECPGLSPDLQKSVLDAFDQLTPKAVSDSAGDSGGAQTEVIRSDDSAYGDSDADAAWADGDWDGHPWWFRPTWDHPVTDLDDWVQWGTDRHEHVIWRWDGHDWRRFGRPDNAPADRPYLPREIGPGVFNPPSHNRTDNNANPNNVPVAPNSNQAPAVVPGSAGAPDANTPQGVVRPQFGNDRPGSTNGTTDNGASGTSNTTPDNATNGTARTNTSTSGHSTGTTSSGTSSTGTRPDSTSTGSGSSTSSDTGSSRSSGSTGSSDTGTSTHERQSSPRESSSGTSGTSERSSSSGTSGGSTGTSGGSSARGGGVDRP